ncbi:MAG: 50S ribosomal protein L18Ae [Candidatus Bathyarchaeia archaeon]|nr:50S ribosomal protein L18a [Candidatus Bathyarchaeota archaeon]MBS7653773.1 50S ribosomal protein L18a [Candidatus Bathyarchaeota archaeon]
MSEIKIYKVTGKIMKSNFKTTFKKEVRALKPEHAIEEIYKLLGSKHRVKRFQIEIENIEEMPSKEET